MSCESLPSAHVLRAYCIPSFLRMKSFKVRVTLVSLDWVLSTCDDRSSIMLHAVS